jgi:hypothetical protein
MHMLVDTTFPVAKKPGSYRESTDEIVNLHATGSSMLLAALEAGAGEPVLAINVATNAVCIASGCMYHWLACAS